MKINFVKMHGLGNDFVIINNTQDKLQLNDTAIIKLADRHCGVGFDQLIVIERADYVLSEFFYRIYNADGGEVYQCGNGARCVAKYLIDNALCAKQELILRTEKVRYNVHVDKEQIIVDMGNPSFIASDIPYVTNSKTPFLREQIDKYSFGVCSIGNPHAVIKVDNLDEFPVEEVGKLIGGHSSFTQGVNVGFMEIIAKDKIKLRVYERGVGETLACGSGACAAVIIGRLSFDLDSKVLVELPGGILNILWPDKSSGVQMIGGATNVFEGSISRDYII